MWRHGPKAKKGQKVKVVAHWDKDTLIPLNPSCSGVTIGQGRETGSLREPAGLKWSNVLINARDVLSGGVICTRSEPRRYPSDGFAVDQRAIAEDFKLAMSTLAVQAKALAKENP